MSWIKNLKDEADRLENKSKGNFLDNFVAMPEGEGVITIRLLPAKEGKSLPFVVSRTHRINGHTVHSPLELVNGKWVGNCPVNNYYRHLWKMVEKENGERREALMAEARAIKPVERYYWNAVVRSADGNSSVKIFSCGKQLHSKIIRAIVGSPEVDEPALGDVCDWKDGRDLKIIKRMVKTGPESYPNYNESKFMGPTVAGTKDEILKWRASLFDLDTLRVVKTYDELVGEVNEHRGIKPEVSKPEAEAPKPTTSYVDPKMVQDGDEDFYSKLLTL